MMKNKISKHQARLAGNILNVDWEKVSFAQFRKGLEVELEHGTKNPEYDVTRDDLIKVGKIALAHLEELPDYYTRLEKVEKDLHEGAMFGRAIDYSVITEDLINRLAKKLNLGIENMNPKEVATGIIEELGHMMTYNENDLNYEKLSKAMLKAYENIKTDPGFYSTPAGDTFAHVLTGKQFGSGITIRGASSVNEYVDLLVAEDLSDMLKTVKSAPEQAWQKVKQKFSDILGKFKQQVNTFSGKLSKAASSMSPVYAMIKQAEASSGEKFPISEDLKLAISLPALAKESQAEVANETKEVKNVLQNKPQQESQAAEQKPAQDKTPAKPEQQPQPEATKQESVMYMHGVLEDLSEMKGIKKINESNKTVLNESVSVVTVVGFALALLSGISMVSKSFHKLAKKFGMQKTANVFNSIHKVAHAAEHKTVDFVVPDRLSYALYGQLWKSGFKLKTIPAEESKKIISFEDYKQDKYESKTHVESIVYKFLLSYFLINGTIGAINSGISLLGLAEGAASTVKAIEVATAVTTAARVITPIA